MITFEVNSEPFIEYLRTVEKGFYRMVETMKNVALIIELETVPYVPLDTSALEQSFEYQIKPSSNFIVMNVGYDAVDPKSGFHYALYQHENELNHPRRGVHKYLTLGIMDSRMEYFELIEKDYLSLFGSGFRVGSNGQNMGFSVLDIGE